MEHEVGFARHHPGAAHDRPAAGAVGEGFQVDFRLAVEADEAEGDDVHAERWRVEQRAVALDDALVLEALDAAQAGRGGDADPARQLDIGHASVILQLAQDLPVDGVEIGLDGHGCSGKFAQESYAFL